ncbi:COP9 signalosome complex subunit 3 isoform X6 [Ammospiza nelsoni]|uniref:COP9 signalosome complex subunit 3 isoform X11 n=1 Tax=Parus major TaxID=9157 RepID=UPI0007711C6B|nr:COP9 signalosome complex subunit 3 isoform X11 [Parus major]XP_038006713.1 COP9 signalosome complex subunit 3 isoform X4 [Motacilla alba alba]XP_058671661.1 COP9 signalosome complex subunit 3 isoform X7 [Ammospiza caudacuta]XP_059340002.1 COP9 signalosome complex subunit 3 isoform X6 [Ammospiza nelsoni]
MASALEQFVNSVRQLSAQGQMTQLCELINKSGELLAKNLSHLDTVLGALDVQEHSLGVLAVLFVKFSMPSIPDFETLFSQVQLFISTCNGEHIRYATDTFAGLCHQLTNALVERKQPLSNAYHELAQVYSTNKPSELRNLVNKHSETFTRDNNMGLVKQCLSSLYKKNIQRLTKTFLTLSLQDMASRVQLSGPQEAEKYVLHMIEDGEIFASINQKDGMVCFHDNPEKYNNPAMLHNIDQEMLKCIELDERLKAMDQEITVNPQFVQKSMGSQEDDSGTKPSSYS